jgi:hypothetical protein
MYWNPASLVFAQNDVILANYALEKIYGNDNVMTENIVFPVSTPSDWNFGFGLTLSHAGIVSIPDDPNAGLNFRQYGLEVAVARRLNKFFSIGLITNSWYGKGSSLGLGAISTAVGAFYAPSPGVRYGAVYQGVGWGVDYGVVDGQTVPSRTTLSQSLQVGLSLSFPARVEKQFIVFTIANQKLFGVAGLVYKGGVEVIPVDALALRIGYWVGPESVAAKFGAGVLLGTLRIDYASSLTKLEPQFHQISVSVILGNHSAGSK